MATTYADTFLHWLRQCPAGSLSPQEVAHLIHQAANALQPLHNDQSAHGHVTPASFLVRPGTTYPGLPDLQLADYNNARNLEIPSNANSAASIPRSMAPEQWRGVVIPATDQYALAVLAYELLTWQSPFLGNQEQLLYQHMNVQPRPPSDLNARIPPALDAVILCALAKRSEDRYPSISTFADAFQQAVQSPRTISPLNPGNIPDVVVPSQPWIANITSAPQVKRVFASLVREVVILAIVFIIVLGSIGFGFYTIVKNNQTTLAHFDGTATPITALSGTHIFADNLSSNTNSMWFVSPDCVFRNGTYHVLVPRTNEISTCGLRNLTFTNAAMQVDVTLLSGYSAGLIFRFHTLDGNQYYNFEITNQREFFLAVHGTNLFPLTKSNAIAPGRQKNTLLVIAEGSDFKLYINGVFVHEAQDSSYTTGPIGFGVEAKPPVISGEASFFNLKVYSV
jgi:eukaryotic-like serine/threonine-protein kinase